MSNKVACFYFNLIRFPDVLIFSVKMYRNILSALCIRSYQYTLLGPSQTYSTELLHRQLIEIIKCEHQGERK